MTIMVKVFGIKNCDTMKKAFTWLEAAGVAYEFHDYKRASIDRASLEKWCQQLGWEVVLNRAGLTFKKLDDAAKRDLNETKAIELMLAQPSMIKRPIIEIGSQHQRKLLVGFKPDDYAAAFK